MEDFKELWQNYNDPSEEYFRNKKKDNDEETYFPQEESDPPHY